MGNAEYMGGVSFGTRDMGMAFSWDKMGASLGEIRCLGSALAVNESLVSLDVTKSNLDDDQTRVLVAGLMDNHTLTSLSLAHNAIGDRGGKALAKYLALDHLVLASLDVSDNKIGHAGGVALGHALHANSTLLELNLRLNRLGEGCAYVCAGLVENATLTSLSLAANSLDSVQAVIQLRDLVSRNETLTALDISANAIMSKLGTKLKDG